MIEQFPGADDPGLAAELFRQFHVWYRQRIDDSARHTTAAIELNKQFSAYFERVLLISLGTLALSVTSLTAFIPKVAAGPPFPRHPFLWLIVPAWAFILWAVFLCKHAMISLVITNNSLLQQLQKLTHSYSFQELYITIRKLSGALSGHESSEKFAVLSAELDTFLADYKKQTMEQVAAPGVEASKRIKYCSRWAVLSLEIALILFCIFAIKVFISV